MRNIILLQTLLFYSASSFASLPYINASELYERADVVFIGNRNKMEADSEPNKFATLNNLFTIKGEPTSEILFCGEPSIDKYGFASNELGVGAIGTNNHVYFFKKKNGCHVGAFGYKSIIYINPGTNCIYAEFAYPFEDEYKDKLEPLELFVKKLIGDNGVISFPESFKTEKCE